MLSNGIIMPGEEIVLRGLYMFGDSAYLKHSHTRSYIKDGNEADKRWNRRARRVRVSIEWNYGATASLFPYLTNKRKFQLLQSDTVSQIYKVATLFRNLHIGFYGCQSSNYFDIPIPRDFVYKYLAQKDW